MLLSIKNFVNYINYSWLNFKLQTQIVLTTTLILLLLGTSIYWSITSLGNLVNINNSHFINDINSLLRDDIVSLLEKNRSSEVITFCERFYKTSTSLRYIIFIDSNGVEYGIPYNYREILSHYDSFIYLDRIKNDSVFNNILFRFNITSVKVITLANQNFLGLLVLGNDSEFTILNNVIISNEIFFSIIVVFVIVIVLSIIFVKIAITRPLSEVSKGLVGIASGDFSRRVNSRFGGELGALAISFNDLGRRLQLYEEQTSEQLFSEKIKLESLITTITDGALLVDTNLRIVLVNSTAIKIFGWKTKTKLVGTPIWDHLPIILQKKLFVTLQGILFDTQSATFDGELENKLPLFPKQSIRMILNVIYDSTGVNKIPIGIGITIQDMTKVFELDKTQNRFMSNISHELRTPLFNIKSFIETIKEYDYTLSSWQKRYFLDIVEKETNRLTRLVNDILCISKLDSLQNLALGAMNIEETINQATANYQIIAKDKILYLHSEIFTSNLDVKGNKDLLLQVLINLVGNALKFTYKRGEIVMRAYKLENRYVRVEIIDTGIGIIYNYQQYIFQRFYRIENEVHTLKGTGLGLSIVGTILSEHKSKINLVSRYSVGSAFWFDLPCV